MLFISINSTCSSLKIAKKKMGHIPDKEEGGQSKLIIKSLSVTQMWAQSKADKTYACLHINRGNERA